MYLPRASENSKAIYVVDIFVVAFFLLQYNWLMTSMRRAAICRTEFGVGECVPGTERL